MAENRNPNCPCTYPCARHGKCEACQAYHKYDKTCCQKQEKKPQK